MYKYIMIELLEKVINRRNQIKNKSKVITISIERILRR